MTKIAKALNEALFAFGVDELNKQGAAQIPVSTLKLVLSTLCDYNNMAQQSHIPSNMPDG